MNQNNSNSSNPSPSSNLWSQSIASSFPLYDFNQALFSGPLNPPHVLKHPHSLTSAFAAASSENTDELLIDSSRLSLNLPGFQLSSSEAVERPVKRRKCDGDTLVSDIFPSSSLEGTDIGTSSSTNDVHFSSPRSETLAADIKRWLDEQMDSNNYKNNSYQWNDNVANPIDASSTKKDGNHFELLSSTINVPAINSGVSNFVFPFLSPNEQSRPSSSSFLQETTFPVQKSTKLPGSQYGYAVNDALQRSQSPEFSYARELLRSSGEPLRLAEESCPANSERPDQENNHFNSKSSWSLLESSADIECRTVDRFHRSSPTSNPITIINGVNNLSHSLASPLPSEFSCSLSPTSVRGKDAVEQICSSVFDKLRVITSTPSSFNISPTSFNNYDLYHPICPAPKNSNTTPIFDAHQSRFNLPIDIVDVTCDPGISSNAIKQNPIDHTCLEYPRSIDLISRRHEYPATALTTPVGVEINRSIPDESHLNRDYQPLQQSLNDHLLNQSLSRKRDIGRSVNPNELNQTIFSFFSQECDAKYSYNSDIKLSLNGSSVSSNGSCCDMSVDSTPATDPASSLRLVVSPTVRQESSDHNRTSNQSSTVTNAIENCDEGFRGEDGLWYKRPDIDEQCLQELCDLTELKVKDKYIKLMVEYKDDLSFPLGEGGRELLRACLNAKGCKGRQLQGASVPMLLQLANDWGLWNLAIRIRIERQTGERCPKHEAFVRFKAVQSHLRKFVKREQMHTERDISGQITTIRFEEMKSLTLGKEGREKLRTQLRRLHDRDSHRMNHLLEKFGFKYSELRNATVPQLLKMAHVCYMWDDVIEACKAQESKRDIKPNAKRAGSTATPILDASSASNPSLHIDGNATDGGDNSLPSPSRRAQDNHSSCAPAPSTTLLEPAQIEEPIQSFVTRIASY